jgi:hypothetical protein
MDLVALESEHEAKYFLSACEIHRQYFEKVSHIGGVSINENASWFWITSNKQVNFDLKLANNELDGDEEKNCLHLVKAPRKFLYGRTNCFGNEMQKFVCQKMIFK